jgi:glucosamine--fructose-6-phosphate aminotransferase (isomerizing)
MCGIVGAVAQRNVVPILLEGLQRLEYRGYDSAGLVVVHDGQLERVRSIGRVADLTEKSTNTQGLIGIAHTRWATHGVPSERNAHPHISKNQIAVVHNGIIENYEALRTRLTAEGYEFTSDTDTEVIAHLIHSHYARGNSLLVATQAALAELVGAYAIGVTAADNPDQLVCARRGSPLLLGVGIEEHFIASDVSALLPVTRKVVYLEEGDVVELGRKSYQIFDASGKRVERAVQISELSNESVQLGEYRHYMQKEIHEQPQALADTLESVCNSQSLVPGIFGAEAASTFADIDSILILACGTSYHAGLVARYWLEEISGIRCTVEVASEYRYRVSVPNPKTLVVVISQSGETADTQAALNHAKAHGHTYTLAICNVPESALVRLCKLRLLTRAGPEIGVASTKAFTGQVAVLTLLTLALGRQRAMSAETGIQLARELDSIPGKMERILERSDAVRTIAEAYCHHDNFLYLGRGYQFPVALEGALKLKEISYIHAEGYPAAEMKHGPIALICETCPTVFFAPKGEIFPKVVSSIQEIKARKGKTIVIATEGCEFPAGLADEIITIPDCHEAVRPIVAAVPVQLLSYYIAVELGRDVDKPRNLAKSVTVE